MVRPQRHLLRLVLFLVLTRYQCSADPQRSPNELSLFVTQPFVPEEGELVQHQTTLGSVTGRKEPTMGLHRSNTHYYAFRGIPYAKPPVGNLRLEDPVEVKGGWPGGHLNASQYQPACPQYSVKFNLVLGDEDCLYLNVFTPKLPEAASGGEGLPVFVYIHGGGFLRGSSLWLSAARFTAHQVVFVTINYRLGALGFLSTGDRTIPGNYGSLDQIAALRWVNSHIAQFGGDPSKVTLGGFSAGSASAHLFMISPRAKGLFQKAILMSGTVHGCWSVKDQPHRYATQLANKLGCPLTSSTRVRSCISAKPYQEVIRAQASMLRYTFWPLPYTIVIDAGLRDDPVLPAPVRSLTPTMPMPVLISTMPHDGLKFALEILTSTTEPRNPAVSYEEATLHHQLLMVQRPTC
ncbi:esterase FE4-like [Homarus americanus]|uniref:esterase FE4-like n=1 Tax=Homarus americanus TaxID=6706 RepID=UPI001C48F049|nr:esterase FE4-like [Homarus americanus]